MHRSQSSWPPGSPLILVASIAGSLLGVIAAVPTHALLSPEPASVPPAQGVRASPEPASVPPTQDVRAANDAAPEGDYFPSRFKAPDGPIDEPTPTF